MEALAAPQIELLDDRKQNDLRVLRMRLTSPRQATVMSVYLDSVAEVVESSVNGKRINLPASVSRDASSDWELRYYVVPQEGIEISLAVKAVEPVKLRLVDQTYGLPQTLNKPWEPRPATVIPAALPYSDSTFVSKSFTF